MRRKTSTLFKIMAKEFRKDIVFSVFLMVCVDFIYANFTGIRLAGESGMILWQGGNDANPFGFSTVLLKLLNVSIVLVAVGKMADQLSDRMMLYILARITDYRRFLYAYSAVIFLSGEALLTVSHIVYACFAGFGPEQAAPSLFYLLMDDLGFAGILMLYIILQNVFSVENSFLYILAVYLLHTVLPFPILPAMSTVRFFELKGRIGNLAVILFIAGMDLVIAIIYHMFIQKRRVDLC
ncbi:MAG: hypothetical protein NC432_10745 [Roseburia sp.]|nr:hypothetical protein [Roseburia sp.]MCM1099291.1 hypothetical protein [Ruminococcus flavefaciens]